MAKSRSRRSQRIIRHARVRQKVSGTSLRPRMSVFRSLKHVYVQLIDDIAGATITCASSQDSEIMEKTEGLSKSEVSSLVGALIARRAAASDINTVVFDRGGYQFQGRVKALADSARKGGLVF